MWGRRFSSNNKGWQIISGNKSLIYLVGKLQGLSWSPNMGNNFSYNLHGYLHHVESFLRLCCISFFWAPVFVPWVQANWPLPCKSLIQRARAGEQVAFPTAPIQDRLGLGEQGALHLNTLPAPIVSWLRQSRRTGRVRKGAPRATGESLEKWGRGVFVPWSLTLIIPVYRRAVPFPLCTPSRMYPLQIVWKLSVLNAYK